ncbi:MAG TPA: hypothetical protein VMV77_09120 [Bacteroidales bacterium]|nr:hypothetical protein [Bacteroidales bacterium]
MKETFREFLTSKAIFTWSEIDLIESLYKEFVQQCHHETTITRFGIVQCEGCGKPMSDEEVTDLGHFSDN